MRWFRYAVGSGDGAASESRAPHPGTWTVRCRLLWMQGAWHAMIWSPSPLRRYVTTLCPQVQSTLQRKGLLSVLRQSDADKV